MNTLLKIILATYFFAIFQANEIRCECSSYSEITQLKDMLAGDNYNVKYNSKDIPTLTKFVNCITYSLCSPFAGGYTISDVYSYEFNVALEKDQVGVLTKCNKLYPGTSLALKVNNTKVDLKSVTDATSVNSDINSQVPIKVKDLTSVVILKVNKLLIGYQADIKQDINETLNKNNKFVQASNILIAYFGFASGGIQMNYLEPDQRPCGVTGATGCFDSSSKTIMLKKMPYMTAEILSHILRHEFEHSRQYSHHLSCKRKGSAFFNFEGCEDHVEKLASLNDRLNESNLNVPQKIKTSTVKYFEKHCHDCGFLTKNLKASTAQKKTTAKPTSSSKPSTTSTTVKAGNCICRLTNTIEALNNGTTYKLSANSCITQKNQHPKTPSMYQVTVKGIIYATSKSNITSYCK